jgi:outer membrane protein assembly factor BamA
VLGLPVDLLATATHQGRALDFWTLDYIAELALRHRVRWLLTDTTISAFVRQKITREIGTNILNESLVSSGNVRTSTFGLRIRSDLRNDRSWPTKGILFEGQVDQARNFLGGNSTYTHFDLLVSGYYPLTKKLSAALHLHSIHFNNVKKLDDTANVLPSAERVYLGGADTVRGFRERALGPFVGGVDADFGASHRNIIKLEARYRLLKPIGITAFMDFGNLYFSDEESVELGDVLSAANRNLRANRVEGWYDFLRSPEKFWRDQYVSYGVGLNAITPLGSLNFAYGIPLKAPDDIQCKSDSSNCPDKSKNHFVRGRFHLNFGVNF